MQEIKTIFDPSGILNPDVIITRDKLLHIRDLKPIPAADPIIDKCIECGFCEVMCPSRAITLTPRQRIVANREIAALRQSGQEHDRLAEIVERYQYRLATKPVPLAACAKPPARWVSIPAV
ncbi:(Fe-S)-binding protein [Paludibacterium denitrificans]|uniref:(Fe-S)-binding protein n=1 Tax=Paludibacterium denitrificans TaxID=2675226 RepID=UPI001E5ABCBB|nr:(Fe-S)-binding protein [Paludibacterium denitrificans]